MRRVSLLLVLLFFPFPFIGRGRKRDYPVTPGFKVNITLRLTSTTLLLHFGDVFILFPARLFVPNTLLLPDRLIYKIEVVPKVFP